MLSHIDGVKIRGMCATVPSNISYFEEEMKHFPFSEQSSKKLARVMGFKEHRISDPQTTPCDLASFILNYLFGTNKLKKDNVQALIVVAQMADHIIPGNSKIIHGQLGLNKDVYCVDMYENCTGFISGLHAAASLLKSTDLEEVVLVTTDCAACTANILDRNTYPLCGDAAAVTLVSKSSSADDCLDFTFHTDGSRHKVLYVPAGGRRMPLSEETAKITQDEMGNYRSLNHMYMDGTAVFQFVMEEVPSLVQEVCDFAKIAEKDIDYHLTHQPNKFMLEKLADLMNVPRERLFNNVVEYFGNTSPVTIPVNIAYNLGQDIIKNTYNVCYSAFGAGLSLAACVGKLGNLDFCDLIEHSGNGTIEYNPHIKHIIKEN